MANLFWLTRAQIQRISSYFPLSHGVPRVDDQQVVSGIIHVTRNGLSLVRCAARVWPAHHGLQPLQPLVPARSLAAPVRESSGDRRGPAGT
jgi:transposase